jgi:CHAT domain-containing protein
VDCGIELRSPRKWMASCGSGLLIILLLNSLLATTAYPIQRLPLQDPESSRPSPDHQEFRTLAPHEAVERELASGKTHSYRFTLAPGEHLRVAVAERGIDTVVTLVSPAGQRIAESNNALSRLESLSLVAETRGEFRLDVRPAVGAASAGRYEIKVAELRAATEHDRVRAAAERAFEAGKQLCAQGTAVARRGAVKKYEEALALQREAGDRRGEAFTLYGLGLVHYDLCEWRKSLPYFQQVLMLTRDLGERKAEAWTLIEIGYACNYLGEKQQALEYLNEALPLLRDLGERSREAFALASIGLVYGSMSEREHYIAYYQRALAIWRDLGDRRGEATSLAAIGGGYDYLGEKQKALEYLHQAVPLLHAVGASQGEAHTLYVLGLIYDSLNEREKAVEYFNQALALRKTVGHRRGQAMLEWELGNIYEGLGDRQQSLAHYHKALAFHEEAKDERGVAALLRNIGLSYDALGEKQKAVAYFERALPLMRLGWNRFAQAETLLGLGKVLSEMGEHQQALVHLHEALGLLRKLNSRFFEVQTLYWIARSERGRGNLLDARASIEEALGKIEHLRSSFYEPELRTTVFTKAQDFYELKMDLLARTGGSQPDQALVDDALEASEQSRARTMLDLLAEARIDIRQGISEQLKQREQASQARLSALQSQLIQIHQQPKADQRRIATLEGELKQVEAEREALACEIRRQHPRYAEILYPRPLGAQSIRRLLDPQTALLQYSLGQETSFLFVVTRESVSSFRLPKAGQISPLVEELRAALKSPGRRGLGSYRRAAEQLYQMLIAPAEGTLATKQKLMIAPDGPLYYLPFEALLVKGAGAGGGAGSPDYLLKRWSVSYVPSASVLASLRQNRRAAEDKPAKEFLAFADPDYEADDQTQLTRDGKKPAQDNLAQAMRGLFDGQARWELTRLAESHHEATEIARLYRPEQVALYLGPQAKEENVKGNCDLATARRIHFATHGLTNERQPQYSGLVLTLDDNSQEDGLLQVYEIFNLKLKAELVVLSACQTGLGKELEGEGMIGLTRAFMYAGVPSVVVSLWQVADRSTAELMVKFYQQMDRVGDKAEALRRAKLELIDNSCYQHPYYWAPFVIVGDTK